MRRSQCSILRTILQQQAIGAIHCVLKLNLADHGYEVTGGDVLDAYTVVTQAAAGAGVPFQRVNEQIREMTAGAQAGNSLMRTILGSHLSS